MQLFTPSVICIVALPWLVAPTVGQTLPTAEPSEVGLSAERLDGVGPTVQKLIDDEKVAGVVTIIARRGKVAQFETYGMMDREAKRPMRKDTIFRIYSMTKPITSTAVMMLCDEGKLKLDDPVSRYLPELEGMKTAEGNAAAKSREMSVRDLLRHTSGLPNNATVDGIFRREGVKRISECTLKQCVENLHRVPLRSEPGTEWYYSIATDVLARLVEVASGKPFDEFLTERIFEPLGMKDTGFVVPAEKLDRFAVNYGPKPGGGLRMTDAPATSRFTRRPKFFSGGGGLVSTATDYMRFCLMLADKGTLDGKRLLKAETVEQMTRNQLAEPLMPIDFASTKRDGFGFGLGFSVCVERSKWEPAARVGEYGWFGSTSTHFWISPKDDLVVIILTQGTFELDIVERAVKPLVYGAIVED